MADRILTLRELNRTTLARQMLLGRAAAAIPEAVERLVGLQAQAPAGPYVGLWTRLEGLERDHLGGLIAERAIVKAAWLRGTLHLVTADDYRTHRATLQPMLSAGFEGIAKRRGPGVDVESVVAEASGFFGAEPRTFAELSTWLAEQHPDDDLGSLRHAVRMHLPLVQVPVDTGWSYPAKPRFALADDWLGADVPTTTDGRGLDDLVRRYLAAFGPASVTDIQTWSGCAVKDVVERLRPELAVYRDEARTELFDLAEIDIVGGAADAPPRFLPEYDNVLLSHRKRTRIVADEHRKQVYLPGLRVAPTVLVDGFVAGTWKVAKAKGTATLTVSPFGRLAKADRAALADDAERLVRFVEPGAKAHAVELP